MNANMVLFISFFSKVIKRSRFTTCGNGLFYEIFYNLLLEGFIRVNSKCILVGDILFIFLEVEVIVLFHLPYLHLNLPFQDPFLFLGQYPFLDW